MGLSRRASFCLSTENDGLYRSNSLPTLPMERGWSFRKRQRGDSVFNRKCCESTKICWWEPDPDYPSSTVDFCLDTSLHGMKYICQPQRHLSERIFWLFGFIFGILAAGWLISNLWVKYLNSPVIVTFEPFETTVDKIPFPAITICNMNKVLRSKAEKYIKLAKQSQNITHKVLEARKNVFYMDHVCSSTRSFSQRFNYSLSRGSIDDKILELVHIKDGDDEQRDVVSFLQKASQKCSDMLLRCIWNDDISDCSDLFKPVETDFGKCCAFNMVPPSLLSKRLNNSRDDPQEVADWSLNWDIERNGILRSGSEEVHKFGSEDEYLNKSVFPRRQLKAGKTSGLSILLNPDLQEYFCTSSDSQGFRLAKHLPIEVPHVMDLGIAIKPNTEVYLGIKPEITLAHPKIKDFKQIKRNCFFPGERELAYYTYYTATNCIEECIANKTYFTCGCVRYYMPRDDTRDLCGPSKSECAEDVKKAALQGGAKSGCDFCLPSCAELEYFSEASYTNIQRGTSIWFGKDNLTAKWAHNNVSIVHIFFAQDSTYARVRKELYGLVDLIANTGGILGLCLGFSGLSLIELIYFYTFRAWCRIRRRQSFWTIAALKIHRLWKRAKSRHLRQSHHERRVFRANNNQRIGIGGELQMFRDRDDPFITIPLEFNSKLLFGERFPSVRSQRQQHLD